MCIWPISAFVSSVVEWETFGILLFLIPISLSGLIIYSHIKTINSVQRPKIKIRIILSVIPFGLLVAYLLYILKLVKTGQITIG
jgi:hydrogenase/urease accessory protein HupE